MERKILLNPGPATTTETVKLAQVVPDICPREAEFGELMEEISRDLVRIVHGEEHYEAVLFCGSGTLCMEVCVTSLVPEGKKLLIVNNGSYSARAAEIARAFSIPHTELKFPVHDVPDLAEIERVLQEGAGEYAVLYTTHQETGTGLLNPIREIGEIAHRYGAITAIDTTSTYAMLPIDLERDRIDFCMASAQKGIQAMTGLSYVIGRRELIEKSKEYPLRSYYTNLYLQYDGFRSSGQMRFTPPVQVIYSARQALKEYFAEGEAAKWARHTRVMDAIHAGVAELGLTEVLPREKQAGLVAAILYPEDEHWSFEKIHNACYQKGFTIYPGKMQEQSTFRLCALGAIEAEDIHAFFRVLREAMEEQGVALPIKGGAGR